MKRDEFIDTFGPIVIEATNGTGLFPSVMMAQAIIESSDSKGNVANSELARKYNNYFGIKARDDWKGEKVLMRTREVRQGQNIYINDYFRVYKHPVDSFKDRVRFLQKNPRYVRGGVFSAKTPQEQTQALESSGYATDPHYNETLNGLIASLKLVLLDVKKK